jgi:hypothetical protein
MTTRPTFGRSIVVAGSSVFVDAGVVVSKSRHNIEVPRSTSRHTCSRQSPPVSAIRKAQPA